MAEVPAVDVKREVRDLLARSWDEALSRHRALERRLRAAKLICLFGAGEIGQAVASDLTLAGIRVDSFCDNNRALWGTRIQGAADCISVAELTSRKDDTLVLVTSGYHREICAQLAGLGLADYLPFSRSAIRNGRFLEQSDRRSVQAHLDALLEVLADERSRAIVPVVVGAWLAAEHDGGNRYASVMSGDQYFPTDIVTLSDHEVFVDGGAFTGDTLAAFLSRVGGRFDQVLAYELDQHYFGQLQQQVERLGEDAKKIQLFNLGLYNDNRSVRYQHNLASSAISADAGEWGAVVRLSDHQRGRPITFVKMDIEGAELAALQGAAEIIAAARPKLAICTYHEPEHLWEIPLYLKQLNPAYKIFLRHHSALEYETVCYAIA
jgi:FkbM family methyltransferase